MKKMISVFAIILTCFLSGCAGNNSGGIVISKSTNSGIDTDSMQRVVDGLFSDYYPVMLRIKYDNNLIFNKNKSLSIFIDGEKIDTMKQGDLNLYGLILSTGEHNLSVYSLLDKKAEVEFVVGREESNTELLIFMSDIKYKSGNPEIEYFVDADYIAYSSDAEYYYNELTDINNHMDNCISIGNFLEIYTAYEEQHNPYYEMCKEEYATENESINELSIYPKSGVYVNKEGTKIVITFFDGYKNAKVEFFQYSFEHDIEVRVGEGYMNLKNSDEGVYSYYFEFDDLDLDVEFEFVFELNDILIVNEDHGNGNTYSSQFDLVK